VAPTVPDIVGGKVHEHDVACFGGPGLQFGVAPTPCGCLLHFPRVLVDGDRSPRTRHALRSSRWERWLRSFGYSLLFPQTGNSCACPRLAAQTAPAGKQVEPVIELPSIITFHCPVCVLRPRRWRRPRWSRRWRLRLAFEPPELPAVLVVPPVVVVPPTTVVPPCREATAGAAHSRSPAGGRGTSRVRCTAGGLRAARSFGPAAGRGTTGIPTCHRWRRPYCRRCWTSRRSGRSHQFSPDPATG